MPWIWIKVFWDDWKWRRQDFNGDLFHRSSVVSGFPAKNLLRSNSAEKVTEDRKLLRLLQKRNRIMERLVGLGNKDS